MLSLVKQLNLMTDLQIGKNKTPIGIVLKKKKKKLLFNKYQIL